MESPIFDPYAILSISPTATQNDIKKAYRQLAIVYHPDKNQASDTTAKFQKLQRAFQLLNDPDSRAKYDRERGGRTSFEQKWSWNWKEKEWEREVEKEVEKWKTMEKQFQKYKKMREEQRRKAEFQVKINAEKAAKEKSTAETRAAIRLAAKMIEAEKLRRKARRAEEERLAQDELQRQIAQAHQRAEERIKANTGDWLVFRDEVISLREKYLADFIPLRNACIMDIIREQTDIRRLHRKMKTSGADTDTYMATGISVANKKTSLLLRFTTLRDLGKSLEQWQKKFLSFVAKKALSIIGERDSLLEQANQKDALEAGRICWQNLLGISASRSDDGANESRLDASTLWYQRPAGTGPSLPLRERKDVKELELLWNLKLKEGVWHEGQEWLEATGIHDCGRCNKRISAEGKMEHTWKCQGCRMVVCGICKDESVLLNGFVEWMKE